MVAVGKWLATPQERYAESLPSLVDEVASLSAKVDVHLKQMGLQW